MRGICFGYLSVMNFTPAPRRLESYGAVERTIEEMGMKILVHEAEHLRCGIIEKWYPVLKDRTLFTKIYDELPEVLQDFLLRPIVPCDQLTGKTFC